MDEKKREKPILNFSNTIFSRFILSWIGQTETFQSEWRRQVLFYVFRICTTFRTPEDTIENWENSNLDRWTPLEKYDDIKLNYVDLLCLYIRVVEPRLHRRFLIEHTASIHYSDQAVLLLEEPLRIQLMESPNNAFMFENALLFIAFALDTRVRRFCLTPTNALDALKCVPPDGPSTQALIKIVESTITRLSENSIYHNLLATGSLMCQFIIYGQKRIAFSEEALNYAPLVCFPQVHWTV